MPACSLHRISLDDDAMHADHNHLQEQDDGSELELQDLIHQLPDDTLANVLGHLPPSSLAASRCVRKHWCSLIDARRLLRADLLPLHLDGFFFNPSDQENRPSFLGSPSATRRITGRLLNFPDYPEEYLSYIAITDQCNGLLLIGDEIVLNPATRQWANLPASPEVTTTTSPMAGIMDPEFYLAYDPMLSPQHYEVFLIHSLYLHHPSNSSDDDNGVESAQEIDLSAEWPPSPYTTHVFSSRKWRWEERSFIRQGEPAGTIADMVRSGKGSCQAVYFRGALYVHCQNDTVMRIALSDDTYQMIKPPAGTKVSSEYPHLSYLGKSEKGVYSALLYDKVPRCRVWLLNERFGHPEWVLKSNINLVENISLHYVASKYSNRPWTVDEAPAQDKLNEEWDFDDGIVLKTTPDKPYQYYCMVFLGFHPYKEIVFFRTSSRVLSYHLNTLKVQDLGKLSDSRLTEMESSFPYTACWMRELFENN